MIRLWKIRIFSPFIINIAIGVYCDLVKNNYTVQGMLLIRIQCSVQFFKTDKRPAIKNIPTASVGI